MKIEPVTTPSTLFQPQQHSSSPLVSRFHSEIQSLEYGTVKRETPLILILEDIIGFISNLFFFPFLAHEFLLDQILLVILLPILLPYIIIAKITYALMNLCTCGWIRSCAPPKLDLSPPKEGEKTLLIQLVKEYGNPHFPEGHAINLLHILKRYLVFTVLHRGNEGYGGELAHFQSVIEITVDGKSQIFQFSPGDDQKETLKECFEFIGKSGGPTSQIKYTFLPINYQYFFGVLKMKIKTHIVVYDCEKEGEEAPWICGGSCPFFSSPSIGNHIEKDPISTQQFSLLPRLTRHVVTAKINSQLTSQALDSSSISLLSSQQLVRG